MIFIFFLFYCFFYVLTLVHSLKSYGFIFFTLVHTCRAGNSLLELTFTELIKQVAKFAHNVRTAKLRVVGSGGLTFQHEGQLSLLQKTVSIFIQTNKPKYKPGNKG